MLGELRGIMGEILVCYFCLFLIDGVWGWRFSVSVFPFPRGSVPGRPDAFVTGTPGGSELRCAGRNCPSFGMACWWE